MNVVIVESPAKAKTINKYLGRDYKVVASYGHVRDLPPRDGSVRPDDDFDMSWEVDGRAEKHMKAIAEAVRGADKLFLATDPDREGEAISWHLREVLKQRRALKDVDVKRVVFNEVTRNAVLDAFRHPREIDRELVDAYLARRALDYLVGFTLSPVLWRKLPGSRSAGRVQSVALRLICEREAEVEAFRPREYWSVEVEFQTEAGDRFTAKLSHIDGKKVDRFDLDSEAKALAAADKILAASGFNVASVEHREVRRNPFPPFTTSTLQQEASRKLGFGATRTMQVAQRLYEGIDLDGDTVGLITYMRTDGVTLAAEAIAGARQLIGNEFGGRYLPPEPRVYRSQAKNAQEAHEAIRPTDMARKPGDVGRPSTYASILQVLQDRDYVRLDKRRFIPEDRGRLVTAFLTSFFERYVEYNFTADLENQLDEVSGGRVDWKALLRDFWRDFSTAIDGTKELTITAVLEALDAELGRHFFPENGSGADPRLCPNCGAGRLSLKLGKFGAFIGCSKYPECRFTRPLGLDTEGETGGADMVLGNDPATGLAVAVKKGPYGHYIQLGEAENGEKPKRVALPRSIKPEDVDLKTALGLLSSPRDIGPHPETGESITAGIGRFGPYLKHGSAFTSLAADDDVLTIGLNRAVTLLAEAKTAPRRGPQLLREIGPHPDGGVVGLYRGRYGPYVSHDKIYASLPKGADPDTYSLEDAIPLLAAQKAKGKGKSKTRRPQRKAAGAVANGDAKPVHRSTAAKRAPAKAKAKPVPGKAKGKQAPKKKPAERSANRPT